jgi:hypothetical protein
MRSRFGCTAILIIGALVAAIGALAFALAGTMTIALVDTFSVALTNVALIGVILIGAGGVGVSLVLRHPAIKQLVISGLARKFHLPEPRPPTELVMSAPQKPVLMVQPRVSTRSAPRRIQPQIVEGWFDDDD